MLGITRGHRIVENHGAMSATRLSIFFWLTESEETTTTAQASTAGDVVCLVCKKKFTRHSVLNIHMQMVHGSPAKAASALTSEKVVLMGDSSWPLFNSKHICVKFCKWLDLNCGLQWPQKYL